VKGRDFMCAAGAFAVVRQTYLQNTGAASPLYGKRIPVVRRPYSIKAVIIKAGGSRQTYYSINQYGKGQAKKQED
jgi:hypothetical protein